MERNTNTTAEKAAKKNIDDMNLAELRKERHYIAARISGKKKAGKDVTELLEYEKTVVSMIANLAAIERANKAAEKQVIRANEAARRADEKAAMTANGDSTTTTPEVAETPAE